jgi:hypothetical protein
LTNSVVIVNISFSFNGTTAHSGPGRPHYRGFTITPDTSHPVGLLWTSDQPDIETFT